MAKIELPATLTVEEKDVPDPEDRWGDPLKKVITVRFGDFFVAQYEVTERRYGECLYFKDGEVWKIYDTPEEFLASKLAKIFELIG